MHQCCHVSPVEMGIQVRKVVSMRRSRDQDEVRATKIYRSIIILR